VGQLLEGKQIDYPHLTGGNVTHRRAQRAKTPIPQNLDIFDRVADEAEADEPE
jgi:hypothetical protein